MSEQLSNDFKLAIPPLYSALEKLMIQAMEIKKTINTLSLLAGDPTPFKDIDTPSILGSGKISPDQFYGKPFASAAKSFLKLKGKAATAEEILDALVTGGFEFPEDWDEKYYLRSVATSLSKNTNDFVNINSGDYKAFGLWEFYPEKKKKKEREKGQREKQSKDEMNGVSEEIALNEIPGHL